MKPYSLDLRERIVAAVEAGQNQSQVAKRFAVSSSTVSRYLAHRKERETLAPKLPPGAKTKLPEPVRKALSERVADKPDVTIAEHQAWLAKEHAIIVGLATVHRVIQSLGFTYKKSPSSPANETRTSAKRGGPRYSKWQSSV